MPNEPRELPKRFFVVPKVEAGRMPSASAVVNRLLHGEEQRATTQRSGRRAPTKSGPPLKVVETSPVDGAVLVEAASAAQVEARAPEGAHVFEEHWYSLERPSLSWLKLSAPLQAPATRLGHTMDFVVTVVLASVTRRRLANAFVTLLIDEANSVGLETTTDRYGHARFKLSSSTRRVDSIGVQPMHSGWPVRLADVDIGAAGLELEVPVIDLAAADGRGLVYGLPCTPAGGGVRVGVVDTGVGPHSALTVVGGRNTTTENARRLRDEDGHGTHVAGVIASSAADWRRGEASDAELFAYRVFTSGAIKATNFHIWTAIRRAARDGCDLINLSLGGGPADPAVRNAIDFAWDSGCVCLAATGNDYAKVCYPSRYPRSVAVSAMGLESSWPAGTDFAWTLGAERGKVIGGHPSFPAAFSNHGPEVTLTAPGVAIVSTIFNDRWGSMCGTSMATPIATGVLARRLAANPSVLRMPRDDARSAAIVKLARDHAEDLGLPAHMQGLGLAR